MNKNEFCWNDNKWFFAGMTTNDFLPEWLQMFRRPWTRWPIYYSLSSSLPHTQSQTMMIRSMMPKKFSQTVFTEIPSEIEIALLHAPIDSYQHNSFETLEYLKQNLSKKKH